MRMFQSVSRHSRKMYSSQQLTVNCIKAKRCLRHNFKLILRITDHRGQISTVSKAPICSKHDFTISAEIHARSLTNFYGQYADRQMNLKFMRRVSAREWAIQQSVIVKNKLMSFFNGSVLLLRGMT